MTLKNKYLVVILVFISIAVVSWITFFIRSKAPEKFAQKISTNNDNTEGQVLQTISGVIPSPTPPRQTFGVIAGIATTPIPANTVLGIVTKTLPPHVVQPTFIPPTLSSSQITTQQKVAGPTPTPRENTITLVSVPDTLTEESVASFTWYIDGPSAKTNTTTVYFGTVSKPGSLSQAISPTDTSYAQKISDFTNGVYSIPLLFIGNVGIGSPATYYARAYTFINGKNYWSDEKTFVVSEIPKNKIIVTDYPANISSGSIATFTWDIYGPSTTTGYTVITGGKESKPGHLNESVAISDTPYSLIFVQEFINGSYPIPLRFIGNGAFFDPGTYYFRAYSWINGKNIWSDEHSLTVQ